ncbi:MAG: carbon storage regulator [Planctomycetia bacterium]|nr:carbon storage regulator [Planctomycetia bacterium]
MLVLSRKAGQRIMVGDHVTITVVQLGCGRVRLGIEAPAEVPVHRGEIHARLRAAIAEPLTEGHVDTQLAARMDGAGKQISASPAAGFIPAI